LYFLDQSGVFPWSHCPYIDPHKDGEYWINISCLYQTWKLVNWVCSLFISCRDISNYITVKMGRWIYNHL